MLPTMFASTEWIDQLWARLRADECVRTEGATWALGPLLLMIEAEQDKAFASTVALRLDLHEGEARDLRAANVADAARVPFAIAGRYSRWKALVQQPEGGDVIDAILQSRLRVKGDLPALVRHRQLLVAIMACARAVNAEFPDDAATAVQPPAGAAR